MEELRRLRELLDDTSTAIQIFKHNIVIKDSYPFFELHKEDYESLNPFFLCEGVELINKYPIEYDDEIEEHVCQAGFINFTGEKAQIALETLLFSLDKDARIAVVRKLLRCAESLLYLKEVDFKLITCMIGFIKHDKDERFFKTNNEEKISFDKLINVISCLTIVSAQLLYYININCSDFSIGKTDDLLERIYPNTYDRINKTYLIDIEDVPTLSIDYLLIKKTYQLCNSLQWENISEKEYADLILSGGSEQTIKIKNKETNRTKFLFNLLSKHIELIPERKEWVNKIKKNIFNDVDFTKATLCTDYSSSGYSSIDIEFKKKIDFLQKDL